MHRLWPFVAHIGVDVCSDPKVKKRGRTGESTRILFHSRKKRVGMRKKCALQRENDYILTG